MKFLCPCCGVKVVPYEEDDEPRLSSNSAVNTDRFLSKNFDENDCDEDFTTALREVIVDTMGKSKGDPSTSGTSSLCCVFCQYTVRSCDSGMRILLHN